jgi:hypothetical protein
MELLGLQEIVAKRDLRLLDQAEKHWSASRGEVKPLATPQESFNMVKRKVAAPMENGSENKLARPLSRVMRTA